MRLLRNRHHDVRRDHPPPHFHASYSGDSAQVDIETLHVLDGWLPPRTLRLVHEWGEMPRQELRDNWERALAHEPLIPIAPLP